MSYQSCIKMPSSKYDNSPEKELNSYDKSSSITYDELISIADKVFGSGKWSHAVTSQTVDFVEYVMGKYHIGCAAFVRVELPDKTYHEEMGYSNAESSVKGSAIYLARASSITYALKKTLLCFGKEIEETMNKYIPKNNKRKVEKLNSDESGSDTLVIKKSKSPIQKELDDDCTMRKEIHETKSSHATNPGQQQQLPPQSTNTNSKNVDNTSTIRTMTEEELRNERKRKQREKQEEYRRLMMKDKESKGEEKLNPKF